MNGTVRIPPNVETVPRGASDRLLEKIWRARVKLKGMPQAYEKNCQLRYECSVRKYPLTDDQRRQLHSRGYR